MGWRTVMITQHAKISYSSHQLVVQTRDGTSTIPISDIQVLLIGTLSAVITSAAINALMQVQAKVIFTGHNGQPVCETRGYYATQRDGDLIKGQVNWTEEQKQRTWTQIIRQKISMQIQTCELLAHDAKDLRNEQLKIEFNDQSNREAVVARKYFDLIFDNDFTRRHFDPVNAALDYGYAILLSCIDREIVTNGYLTQIGIHHHSDENEFNLGSDLMEPFRPVVDAWVAQQRFEALTPEVKIGLVDLLNVELKYNSEKMLLRHALAKYTQQVLKYLSQESDKLKIEVTLGNEVSYRAINGNV